MPACGFLIRGMRPRFPQGPRPSLRRLTERRGHLMHAAVRWRPLGLPSQRTRTWTHLLTAAWAWGRASSQPSLYLARRVRINDGQDDGFGCPVESMSLITGTPPPTSPPGYRHPCSWGNVRHEILWSRWPGRLHPAPWKLVSTLTSLAGQPPPAMR